MRLNWNPHLVFSLKPKPIVFVGTVRKEKHGIHIYIHTHTQNLTLQEKMIMKKLHMNSLNLLQSQKVLTQKRNKHIDKKAHSIHIKIQVVILNTQWYGSTH